MVFGALTPAGLTQLSGGAATGAQQATSYAMDQFLGVLTDPFVAGRSAPAGEAGTNGGLAYAEDGKGAANAALTAITSPDKTLARDAALVGAAVETRWQDGWSATAGFEGEFSDVTRSCSGKGVMRHAW
jgi:hypothetical protein